MNELFLRDNQKPVKADLLSQLPRSKFQAQSTENLAKLKDDEKRCIICMCDYQAGEELLTLTCFHKFHAECIEKWF